MATLEIDPRLPPLTRTRWLRAYKFRTLHDKRATGTDPVSAIFGQSEDPPKVLGLSPHAHVHDLDYQPGRRCTLTQRK